MENKGFKTLTQLHREEIYNNRYSDLTDMFEIGWNDVIWEDEGELVPISTGEIVFVHEPEIRTSFPFPYSLDEEGDYEKQYELSKQKVNLDYAIEENTKHIDFMLQMLREKPNPISGSLYLVKEERRFPDDTRFKVVRHFRLYPEWKNLKNKDEVVFLKDINDRKKIYSAYKKVRKSLVEKIEKLYAEKGDDAFEIVMYNKD